MTPINFCSSVSEGMNSHATITVAPAFMNIYENPAVLQIINRVITTGRSIGQGNINSHMVEVAEFVIDNYLGDNDYVLNIQHRFWNGAPLSDNQIATVYKIIIDEYINKNKEANLDQ